MASLGVMLFGIVIGYILVTVGVTLYFGLHPITSEGVSSTDALIVFGTGVATSVVGYLGWRGFTYFAY